MFQAAPSTIGHVLNGVCGLPGIAAVALLAGVGLGLGIGWIDPPNARLTDASAPAAGQVISSVTSWGFADPRLAKPVRRLSCARHS